MRRALLLLMAPVCLGATVTVYDAPVSFSAPSGTTNWGIAVDHDRDSTTITHVAQDQQWQPLVGPSLLPSGARTFVTRHRSIPGKIQVWVNRKKILEMANPAYTPVQLEIPDPPPVCGNGTLEIAGAEECDPPDDQTCPGDCLADCTCDAPPPLVCGDGTLQSPEECEPSPGLDLVCPGRCDVATCTCIPGQPLPAACDLNGSGRVDSTDALIINRCSLGLSVPGGWICP